jgi:predicted lysophospholipase L1 biosynthesis ABC-type transport system permease subunit
MSNRQAQSLGIDSTFKGEAPARRRLMSTRCVEYIIITVLVGGIGIAATAISVGLANAQTLHAIAEPDTELMLAMLAAAVAVMGALSAAAVRLAGRSRQR